MGRVVLKEDSVVRGEIIVYHPDEMTRLEVKVENDTVWLNRSQLALLFGRDVKTIGKHINNALREELRFVSTIANCDSSERGWIDGWNVIWNIIILT